VYGAAFSGYNDASETTQSEVIDAFIQEANVCNIPLSKSLRARKKQLHESSHRIIDMLKSCIGAEVDKYLVRIESILFDPKTDVSFHLMNNNCHSLVSTLLQGKDFEYSFPRFPEGIGTTLEAEKPEWPQYLVSFGERIERTKANFHEKSSIVERFLVKNREFDLIDFLEHSLYTALRKNMDLNLDAVKPLYLLQRRSRPAPDSAEFIDTLWEMPRDTLAILQTHLHRPVWKYRDTNGELLGNRALWDNRFLALEQLDIFASLAGSLGDKMRNNVLKTPGMVERIIIPKAHVFGHLHANDKVRIIYLSPVSVIYAILRGNDERLDTLFSLPDESLWSIITGIDNAINDAENRKHPLLTNLSNRLLRAELALIRHSPYLTPAILGFRLGLGALNLSAQSIATAVMNTKRTYKEAGWAYHEFSDLLVVHQWFRKTKSTRKKAQVA
jgi:hypothetical protein